MTCLCWKLIEAALVEAADSKLEAADAPFTRKLLKHKLWLLKLSL